MSFKKWNISKYNKETAKRLMAENDIDALTAVLLSARGIVESESIEAFFSDEYEWIDPFTLPDMDLAVERIGNALDAGETIGIFGDFDADGVTSTALLYSYLRNAGGNVIYDIPDRNKDGYGLNCKAIDAFHEQGVSLIITVDNGISAFDEVAYASEKGIDVVVTDHHMQGAGLPNAVAVVNPHRHDNECAYADWAGVGVAFKLVCALEGGEEQILEEYADLICIGTVADIVSVLGENRHLIKKGLECINHSERLGIVALKAVAGVSQKELTSTDIAFVLSPRINAAGRIGSAKRAVQLLISEDADEAIALADELNDYNAKRIELENNMFEYADMCIRSSPENYDRVLVVCGENFNSGVAGIVASRLCEKYGKPCIVISDNGEDILKGSCRSIQGFNIFDALSACCDSLVQFGGHMLAAGLSVKRDKVNELRELINDYAAKMFRFMPSAEINIDFKINPASIDLQTLQVINRFQPFGMGNAKPLFGIYGAQIIAITPVSANRHIKLTFVKKDTTFSAMYFGHSTTDVPFRKGDIVDLALSIEKNEYYGKVSVSLFIKNIKFSGFQDDIIIGGKHVFENFMRGESNRKEISYIFTDRENIAEIYRFIRSNNGWRFSTEELFMSIRSKQMNYSQMLLSLFIMNELGIVIFDYDRNRIDLPIEPNKVNIPDSVLFQKMIALKKTL